MFSPRPKKSADAEAAKWEAILAAEGMPAEIRPLTASSARDGLRIVSDQSLFDAPDGGDANDWHLDANLDSFGAPTSMANTPTARYWATFGQAVQSLPTTYPKRQRVFLELYADSGSIDGACRQMKPKLDSKTAWRWLKAFAAYGKSRR